METAYRKKDAAVKRVYYLVKIGDVMMRVHASHAEMLAFWLPNLMRRRGITWQ